MSFQDSIDRFSPWWLRGLVGGRFLQSVGSTLDMAAETLVQGFYAGNPLRCEPDALASIGYNRRMRRYPTEPIESYRVRLSKWRQAHMHRGSHYGEMLMLQPYFLPAGMPRIRVVHQAGSGTIATWHTLDPDGTYTVQRASPSNFNWDGVPAQWSRFWVIIYASGLGTTGPVQYNGGATYDGGAIWDGYLTAAQIADLVAIVEDWKAAHSTLWGIIVAKDDGLFDPSGSGSGYPSGDWGFYINNTTGALTRTPLAFYPYDRGQAT